MELRSKNPKKTHEEIVADLKKDHAVTTGSQKAVEKFEKKYPDAIISAKVEELKARNSEISDKLIPSKIPQSQEFSRLITEARDGDQYGDIFKNRPEMKNIIYDIAGGFLRFNPDRHIWTTASDKEIKFTERELELVNQIFKTFRKDHPFVLQYNIPTEKTKIPTVKEHFGPSYDEKILRERINFYQQ